MLSECIYKVLMASGVVTSSDACDLSGAIEAAVLAEQAKAEPVAKHKENLNAELDSHSNFAGAEQQRAVACSVEIGQPMGNWQNALASNPELERKVRDVAVEIARNCERPPQLVFPFLYLGVKDLIDSLYLHPAPAPEGMVKQCEWHHCGDEYMPGTWDGSCGAKWTFTEDGPVENNMRFCPECGGEVVIAAAENEQGK